MSILNTFQLLQHEYARAKKSRRQITSSGHKTRVEVVRVAQYKSTKSTMLWKTSNLLYL